MSENKDKRLSELEMKEFEELLNQLPECVREYRRKNSTEIFDIYLEGFHDGGVFVLNKLDHKKP